MRSKLALVGLLFCVLVCPATSISRWFSSTYHDLRFTLRRYGHCVGDLAPLKDHNLNDTEFLIHQMRLFLDRTNYDNEQMANVTNLMDLICRSDGENNYPISLAIDINKYNHSVTGKEARCRSIDEAMDAMYPVWKRAALNNSEPLDFSRILFYPNSTDKSFYYNLTDLINTSWIKSEAQLESVCRITDSVKAYVQSRSSNSTVQDRSQQNGSFIKSLMEFLDSLLDPILGAQKRLYWESTSRYELVQSRISSGLGSIRDGIGKGLKLTRNRVSGIFSSSGNSVNGTVASNVTTANSNGQATTPTRLPSVALPTTPVSSPITNVASTSTTTQPMLS